DSPESQAALARSYEQLGGLHGIMGNQTETTTAYHKALAIQRRLAAMPGAAPETKLNLASTLIALPWSQKESHPGVVPELVTEAQSVVEGVEGETRKTHASQWILADILKLRADVAFWTVQQKEAMAHYDAARTILESLHEFRPNDIEVLARLGDI